MLIVRGNGFEVEKCINQKVSFDACDCSDCWDCGADCGDSCYDCGIADCTDHCSNDEY